MQLTEHVPLSLLTTLKVGGSARYVATCENEEDITTAIAYARDGGLPWYVISGGSNMLVNDAGYAGVIIRPVLGELSFGEVSASGECVVVAGAGVVWDVLVEESVTRGLWGLENLAGIPGLVGGAPVQNIGAYGADVSETLLYVDVFDTSKDAGAGATTRLTNAECQFGYRDSRFKHDPSLIILRAGFTLSAQGAPRITYPDLAAYQDAAIKEGNGEVLNTPKAIAAAVRTIRSKKFPDLTMYGTAGSFFKNPIISVQKYEELHATYPDLPMFPLMESIAGASAGNVKIPLAWILDHVLNLRGYTKGPTHLFERQPLVLVAESGATATDVESLAHEVEQKVFDSVGISIEREVRIL
jgi:UDP-N-acetylmuramate dehydrogenase